MEFSDIRSAEIYGRKHFLHYQMNYNESTGMWKVQGFQDTYDFERIVNETIDWED